jgi:hypothetical protein
MQLLLNLFLFPKDIPKHCPVIRLWVNRQKLFPSQISELGGF